MPNPFPVEGAHRRLKRVSSWVESWRTRSVRLVLGGLGILLIARLLIFTWVFSVNIPFSDQWYLLAILFDGFQWSDIPAAFLWQNGPHRQGLSFALLVPLYEVTGWNVRLDSMVIAFTLIIAGGLALRLRRQLIPAPWTLWDAALLIAFWALNVFETIVVTPNNSHSIFPLVLVMLIANTWIAQPSWRRSALLIVLTMFAGFTGFGLSILPVLGLLLLLRLRRAPRQWKKTGAELLGVTATLWLFLLQYRFIVAADNFQVLQSNPLDYLRFGIVMFNYFFQLYYPGVQATYYPIGLAFAVAVLWICIQTMRALLPHRAPGVSNGNMPLLEVCLMLCGTTLAYVALTAYGRVQLGIDGANTPRYMALMLPAFCALHLWLHREVTDTKRIAALAVLLLLCVRLVPETYLAYDRTLYYANVKLCWFDSYRQSGDWQQAGEAVRQADGRRLFQPVWLGSPDQWGYLSAHRLGPFASNVAVSVLSDFEADPCEHLH